MSDLVLAIVAAIVGAAAVILGLRAKRKTLADTAADYARRKARDEVMAAKDASAAASAKADTDAMLAAKADASGGLAELLRSKGAGR